MNGETHVAVALLTAAALGFDPLEASMTVSAALVAGALLPDLDHCHGAGALRKPLPRSLRGLSRLPALLFRHRGPLHSLLVLPVLLFAAGLLNCPPLPAPAWAWMGVGCISHLLADALTITGVPLLWPLTRHRFKLPLVRTGGRSERLVNLLAIAGLYYLCRGM